MAPFVIKSHFRPIFHRFDSPGIEPIVTQETLKSTMAKNQYGSVSDHSISTQNLNLKSVLTLRTVGKLLASIPKSTYEYSIEIG